MDSAWYICNNVHVVYDLKSVGALEIEFVAPIPEQIATTHHYHAFLQGLRGAIHSKHWWQLLVLL